GGPVASSGGCGPLRPMAAAEMLDLPPAATRTGFIASGWHRVQRLATGLAPVALERVAERISQRREPCFEVPPLVEPLAKDGLAYLLRARRTNAALRAVELEAARLKRQLTVPEDSPHPALEVLDHVLMVDTQHAARENSIPVLHEIQIRAVIPGDIRDAVGKFLAAREQLL